MPGNPILSGVWPEHEETGVVLKPIVQLVFKGPSLIDPFTWNSGTFALYGPGDVVYDSGPGTLLNSGIVSDPYVLIDDAVIRERIDGTYRLYTSGLVPASGVQISGYLGTSGSLILAEFIPDVPLNPYTVYTAVLVGEDAADWTTSSKLFYGVTSWTSEAQFSGVGTTGSGVLNVLTPYSRILPSILWNSDTGYNDTYRVIISSGSTTGAPKFTWSQDSSAGIYLGEGTGPHDLGEGLTFSFSGVFVTSEEYDIDVYIPKALQTTYSWQFTTTDISGSTPLVEPVLPTLIIDETSAGFGPVSSTSLSLVSSDPDNLEYAVSTSTPYILLEFNTTLSGVDTSGITVIQSPLLGMPSISGGGTVTPTSIEVSGVYLKLWL